MTPFLDGLLAVLFAPRCAVCDEPLATPLSGCVCAACWASVSRITDPVCDGCGDPLPRAEPDGLCAHCAGVARSVDRGRALGEYQGALREIVHALKYGKRRTIARRLGRLMRERGACLLSGADLVVPVPLHPRRQRQRGFNQADELASALGPPVRRVLVRRRATTPQVELPASARRANVEDAFAVRRVPALVRGRLAWRHPAWLEGTSVVLVDDVSTTGSTLEACARALKAAGVREVRALTAARVVLRRASAPPGAPMRPHGRRRCQASSHPATVEGEPDGHVDERAQA